MAPHLPAIAAACDVQTGRFIAIDSNQFDAAPLFAIAFTHNCKRGSPLWVELRSQTAVARTSTNGAQRKHVTLPTDFRSPSVNGHSCYGHLTARFAPKRPSLLVGVFGLRRRCVSGRSSGRPVRGDDLFCAPVCRMRACLADITGSARVQAA